MTLNEYMKKNRSDRNRWLVKRIECADGFTLSVQGSEYNYCSPRVTDAEHYFEVEVGFPSEKPEFFAQYAEGLGTYDDDDNYIELEPAWTDTVYGYVPIELVEQEIAKHGGIKV